MASYIAHCGNDYWRKDYTVNVDRRLALMPAAQAGIREDKRGTHLISYTTLVCTIDPEGWLTCTGTYSATTRRHINRFLREVAGDAADYYTAKRCYERDEVYNIHTGEILALADYTKLEEERRTA